jgi:hypothetical protein
MTPDLVEYALFEMTSPLAKKTFFEMTSPLTKKAFFEMTSHMVEVVDLRCQLLMIREFQMVDDT